MLSAVDESADSKGSLIAKVPLQHSSAKMRLTKDGPSAESFVRGQACGCIGEVCIGNKQIKGMLASINVIPDLITLLAEPDPATQVCSCDPQTHTRSVSISSRINIDA